MLSFNTIMKFQRKYYTKYFVIRNTFIIYNLFIFWSRERTKNEFVWCCTNKHKEETGSNDTCIWLYWLDLNTQNEIIKGIRTVEEIRQKEKQKYFEINEENDELSVNVEWKEKLYQFNHWPLIYESTKKDIEKIY